MQELKTIQFKATKVKYSPLREFTGTWEDFEMYFPDAIILSVKDYYDESVEEYA